MSRKRKAPVRKIYPDPKYRSVVISKFIDLARSVYLTNDIRSEIKLKINKKFGSKLVEVKSYEKY